MAASLLVVNRNQWRGKTFALKSDHGSAWNLSPLPVSSSMPQKGVSFKQEFHTLLTMWLLSAAASSPITNSSSFLPILGGLSFSLADFFFNPLRWFCPIGFQKKSQDPEVSGWSRMRSWGVALFLGLLVLQEEEVVECYWCDLMGWK